MKARIVVGSLLISVVSSCEHRGTKPEQESGYAADRAEPRASVPAARPRPNRRIGAHFGGLTSNYEPGEDIPAELEISNTGDAPVFVSGCAVEMVEAVEPDWKDVLNPESPLVTCDVDEPVEIEPGEEVVADFPGFTTDPSDEGIKCALSGFVEISDGDGNVIDVIDVTSDVFGIGL